MHSAVLWKVLYSVIDALNVQQHGSCIDKRLYYATIYEKSWAEAEEEEKKIRLF